MKKSIRKKIEQQIVNNERNRDKELSDRQDILNSEVMEKYGLTKWTPAEGDNFIQLLPMPEIEEGSKLSSLIIKTAAFKFPLWVHWRVGPNQDSFLCLRKMFDEPCPVCEEFMRRRANNEEWDNMKHLSVPNSPNRWLFYMVDVAEPDKIEENGVQVFLCPVTVEREMSSRMVEKTRSGEIVKLRFLPSDPDEARIFKFHREGTDLNTKYLECEYLDPDTTEGKPEELPDEFYNNPSFEEILRKPSYEEMKKALFGGLVDDDEEEEDDNDELERQSREVFGGYDDEEEDEDDEEEDEDDEEEEEEEEVETPKPTSNRSRRKIKTRRRRR